MPDSVMFDVDDLGLLVCAALAFTMGIRGLAPDTKEVEDWKIDA